MRMRRPRSVSSREPAVASTTKSTSSMTTVSGVKTRVRTGAMFSTTFCLASTSQAATTSAPGTANGRTQPSKNGSGSIPTRFSVPNVRPSSTPPPRARSVK
ncbi:hypothetical protein D3C74_346940 [compost metagenome]